MRGEWAEGRFWPDQGGPLVQVEDAERLERERDEAREAFAIVTDQLVQEQIKNRKLREALTACMNELSQLDALHIDCWKTTEDINDVWNAGKEALEA